MIVLRATGMHWLNVGDPNDDQCAHGYITLAIDDQVFCSPADGELTVSAAALNLLRTIAHDHTPENSVSGGGQLLPCCGFNVLPSDGKFPALILGCSNGIDICIRHTGRDVELCKGAQRKVVSRASWEAAVIAFAAEVMNFYSQSPPKNPPPEGEDAKGWATFWQEWRELAETKGRRLD